MAKAIKVNTKEEAMDILGRLNQNAEAARDLPPNQGKGARKTLMLFLP